MDHAINRGFTGNYQEYFGLHMNENAICYVQLANKILHERYPDIVTIAEEVSGIPGTCRPVSESGLGFDYRLAMAIPDHFIKILKEQSDDEWDIEKMAYLLNNRRYDEKHIAYCESHDQALVGDKTIAFHLMDKEMYTNMSCLAEETGVIARGMALHKMFRFMVHSLAGEGYLNFMGNEFGHPEWLDFPRAGNNESYHYARRQYNLVSDQLLRYKFLYKFDCDLNQAENSIPQANWLKYPKNHAYISRKRNDDKILVYERNSCIFVFNFHSSKSYNNYKIGVNLPGKYKILLSSDEKIYGGYGNLSKDSGTEYFTQREDFGYDGRENSMLIYIPSRVGVCFYLDSA